MATIKKKINELTPKETPVLADSIVISDSENSGKGALVEVTDLQTLIGGGGGAVDSVAGKTGVVTLDASDIAETAALKILTADERTKLTGIAEGAEVNTVDSVAGRTGDVTLDADDVSETATKLWMSDTQSAKLAGIAENANNYTHPETHPQSMIVGLSDALAAKAPLASPSLTGTPTAPTAAAGTDTTQIATTEFVQDALADISIDADPYAVQLTGDQSISGIKTFTSSPVLPTPTAGDNTTKGATTAFVTGAVAGKAPLASPALTGTPTAPTPTAGTNTTQIATTAFVSGEVAGVTAS